MDTHLAIALVFGLISLAFGALSFVLAVSLTRRGWTLTKKLEDYTGLLIGLRSLHHPRGYRSRPEVRPIGTPCDECGHEWPCGTFQAITHTWGR